MGSGGGGDAGRDLHQALSYAFVRQEHLPVAGAGSRRDAAEARCFHRGEPAELSGQVGGRRHHPAAIGKKKLARSTSDDLHV